MQNKWMIGFLVLAGAAGFAMQGFGRKFTVSYFTSIPVRDLKDEAISNPCGSLDVDGQLISSLGGVAGNFETTNKILEQIEDEIDLRTGEKFVFNWTEPPVKQFDMPENIANRHPYDHYKYEEKLEHDSDGFSRSWTWSPE